MLLFRIGCRLGRILSKKPVVTGAIAFIILICVETAEAQLFRQDFSSSSVVSDYVSTSPGNGEFNAIGSSGSGTSVSISNGKLQFARNAANVGSFSRNTGFSPVPSTLLYKFDISISGNTVAQTSAAVFQLGSGFGTGNSAEAIANTYARIAINFTAASGQFQLRDITNGANSTSLSGAQSITWALNNSGATQSYIAPDGSIESVADDKTDIWAGATKLFDDVNIQTSTQSIANMKFAFTGGDGTIQLDNFVLSPFCLAPAISSASFLAISSGSGTFSASLSNTGGSGASVTKRGFQYSSNSSLTNAKDVSESGNFGTGIFSLNDSTLTPNTNYWYRAYAINNCTDPQTTYSHTSGFPSFTTIHAAPQATSASGVSSTGFRANWQAPAAGGNAIFTYTAEISKTGDFSSIIQTHTSVPSDSTAINITNLTSATQYWYRLKAINNGGSSSYSNIIGPVSTLNPDPVITTSGTLNSFSNNLGNVSSTQNFSVSGTNLSGNVIISAPGGFEVSADSGSGFATSIYLFPVNGNISNTKVYARLNANATGNYTGNIAISSNGATTQYLAVNGNCNGSKTSDIIANSIFAYSSNINYSLYQSATITNTTNSLGVFGFILRDGGAGNDADNLPTILSEIAFDVLGLENIRTAALFSGNNLISNSPDIDLHNGIISFTGLSGTNVTANDNSTKAINLRVTFNTSVTDNEQLEFAVKSAATAGGNTSSFFELTDAGGAESYTTSDYNRIEVSANALKWNKLPENGNVGTALTAFSIAAVDANGNTDLDENNCKLVLSSTGTGFYSSSNYSFTNGLSEISNITFSQANTNIKITATAQSCLSNSQITSGNINITGVNYAIGDKRSTSNGNWGNNIWETCTGTNPFVFSNSGSDGNMPDDTNTVVHIEHDVTITGQYKTGKLFIKKNGALKVTENTGIYQKLQIFDGGTITVEAPLSIAAGKPFVIEDGGSMTLNYNSLTSTSSIWDGTENFCNGSTVNITNWNYSASSPANSFIDADNLKISSNSSGYLFGNLSFNGNPSQDFTMITGNNAIKLCSNNFTVTNNSSNYNVVITNSASSVETGGNTEIKNGDFSFAALSTSGTANITLKGKLILSGGNINLNKVNSSSANSVINLYGDLESGNSTIIFSTDDNSKIIFTGSALKQINISGSVGNNIGFEAGNGASVKIINQDLNLSGSNSSFTVNSSGIFDFNGRNITGNGAFTLLGGGTIKISSAAGISSSGTTGNVQTATRTFDGAGIYWYNGNTAQFTGNGLPNLSNDKVVIIDNPVSVHPSAITRINANGRLEIRQGTLIETATEYFADATSSPVAGQLVMSGGTYKILRTDVTVPQLSGTYSISGGTIELAAQGDQKLRGGRTYYNLTFSGSGTKTTGSAISNIGGTVSIKDNTTLDVENSTFSGPAALIMASGRFRMRTLNTTLPQLTGSYSLTGGTIELYGTSATQTHTLRGGVTYYNVELNAAAANTVTGAANILTNASLSVANEFRVKSPASYLIGQTYNINGNGNFILEPGATLKYGSADGIKSSGTGSTDGNIRVAGQRSFSSSANYAFIGSADMVSGNALPSQVNRLTLEKSTAGSTVTLNYDVTANSAVTLTSGLLNTGSNKIILGSSATLTETTASYITGKVETERNVGTTVETFGGMGLSLTASSAPGLTFVSRVTGPAAIQTGQTGYTGIARYFDISAAKNTGLNATMVFSYNDAELNNISEMELALFKSRDAGKTWEYKGFSSRNATSNTVTLTGLDGFSRWTLGSSVTPLPVDLISFTAAPTNHNSINLKWITASELNNDRFDIERSADGINFRKTGEVQGNGTTQQILTYSFDDKISNAIFSSNNTFYYRLKQVDYNGNFEYSEIKKVKLNNSAQELKIYFSNNTDQLIISGFNKNTGTVNIKITDVNGREIIKLSQSFSYGQFTFQVPCHCLIKGVYIVSVSNSNSETQFNTRILKY